MVYEEFKIALAAEVTNLVGEEVNVTLHKVQKNNGIVLDAISVMKRGVCVSPSIYLVDLFQRYQGGNNLTALAKKVISISEKNELSLAIPDDFFMDFHKIRNRICYRIVNYEKNKQMLKDIPHERVMNLAKVYYYSVEPEVLENASVLIRNMDLVRWSVSEKEIKSCAEKNTPCIHKWQLTTMQNLIENIFDEPELELLLGIEQDDPVQLYVLTNEERYFGAACMFYPNVLEDIAKELDSHFYILPSSIHECIIMPESGYFSKEYLTRMVTEINKNHLEEIEVLADCAYFYDRNAKAIMS